MPKLVSLNQLLSLGLLIGSVVVQLLDRRHWFQISSAPSWVWRHPIRRSSHVWWQQLETEGSSPTQSKIFCQLHLQKEAVQDLLPVSPTRAHSGCVHLSQKGSWGNVSHVQTFTEWKGKVYWRAKQNSKTVFFMYMLKSLNLTKSCKFLFGWTMRMGWQIQVLEWKAGLWACWTSKHSTTQMYFHPNLPFNWAYLYKITQLHLIIHIVYSPYSRCF